MKRWFVAAIWLLAMGLSFPGAVQAQGKNAMRVATEIVNKGNYPAQLPLCDVDIRLGGHNNRALGYGTTTYTANNIKEVVKNPVPGRPVTALNKRTVLQVDGDYKWLSTPRGPKFQRARFRLTISVGITPTVPGVVPSFGTIDILYGDGSVKKIILDNSLSVIGTSLQSRYTLHGKVQGENGEEVLILSFTLRGLEG
jgi:hypothetical protein